MRVSISWCQLRYGAAAPLRMGLCSAIAAVGAAIGISAPQLAAASAAAGPSASVAVDTCQEQFLLDRRDDPRNSLKNLHRCIAVRDMSLNMEKFTFWYITLPAHQREDGSWFANEWRNDLTVLESPYVGLKQKDATDLLDKSVVRGLQRGKRDNLAQGWLKSHNPQILAGAAPAEARDAASAKPPAAGLAGTSQPAAAAAESPATGRPIIRAERRSYRFHRRYARTARSYGASEGEMPSYEQLNRAELRADMSELPPVGYRPAPYPYPPPGVLPYLPSAGPLPPYYPLPVPSVPLAPRFQQGDNDAGTVAGAIAENLRSAARALFGPPRNY